MTLRVAIIGAGRDIDYLRLRTMIAHPDQDSPD